MPRHRSLRAPGLGATPELSHDQDRAAKGTRLMGGTSSSQQSTNQESQVTPYGPAAAGIQGILGNLMPSVNTIDGTPQTNQAFGQLEQTAAAGNPYANAIGNV